MSNHTKIESTYGPGKLLPWNISFKLSNMKQIHEAVQALESDIGFWRPTRILLKKLKNATKITRRVPQGQYAYCEYLAVIRAGVFE